MTSIRTIRLLVVEDSPAYRYLIQKAFSRRVDQTRWEVAIAEDGEQALQLLFKEEDDNEPLPDIILLDWHLPKVSGNEVLQRTKGHERLRRIPILVFTASKEADVIQNAYGNYANGFITKPDDNDQLSSIIASIEEFWINIASLPKVSRGA